ncbi:putative ATP-dependent RNA helicase TDRD12 [Hippoglossus hippoglossus]|uniref:putative ATP-dependent RNA helicase TDRD12 n=1 Tax=Hippoglossus hippoglossus TaxID=8267 RepID=UPI00148DAA44|nr:putative ATP-dependent RNA helicase TDRD12 [Hippoglossus hippoglossus]
MLEMSILKVENPSCLWGRVVRCRGTNTETTEEYNSMLSQINLFYHDVTKDLCKLKPTSIEEGQVCVVYWSVMKLWCRAVVESITMDSVSCKARCLLVDHGERLVIASDQIRVAVQNFLQLPFWVKRFHLARIKPTTLRVCVYQENAELIPTAHWDSSATLYLHNLLQASTWTEAVLLESDSDSTSIELYLTVGNIKICVNDDLVAKRFAYYTRESAESSGLDEVDRFPIMLSSSILTQSASTTSSKPTAVTQPPAGKHTDVTASDRHQGRACDWLTAPYSPQSQQHELRTSNGDCRPNITEEQLSTGSQSRSSSQTAATESDSSDDTDSSLAAALTRNLSLFKFLKFLNPGSSYQQATHSVGEIEELNDCQPKELTSASSPCTGQEDCKGSLVESGPAETKKMRSSELAGACSRLLEWLNPEPLNPDPEAGDDAVVPSEPRSNGILVHSALPVQPCTSLDDAPITEALRLVLQRKQYNTLSPADCYSWPAVSRGCNTIIVSHIADQPLSYLAPLLTHILLNSIFSSLTSSTGPIAVLLCPGWEKVQQVYDLLEDFKITHMLHPIVLLLGVGKDEAKTIRIPKNCLLLVTTPFSFVRLLSCHCFMFLRLHHLLLDEADQLFTFAPDEMEIILQHFQKVTSSEEKASSPLQLVAVAKRWTSQVEGLLTNHMPYPCIVMTVPEEAALYGNVQQFILMTLESSKISELLGMLDFSPDVGQKTLIIANCAQEVEDVFKAVSHKSAFCLKTHEGLTYQFDFVIQQWRKNIGPGTHVILVTTNECLKCFGIRDASCVIHYGFPTSPKLFGSRLFSMAENFRNLSERVSTQDQTASRPPVTRSVLLISERNAPHVVGVVRYLGRTNALLPPELLSFGHGIHMAREDLKTNRPLCSYLKSFGVCRDSRTCPDRHKFISQLDQSDLPAAGVIEVLPLYIKTASVFYGRIVRKDDNGFDGLASEMASYYADKKPGPSTELSEGGLYAVQEDNDFHRVKILSVPGRGDHLFFRVLVRFIDTGKEEEVKSHQILQLPEQFHSLSCQAVEIIVCRIKPVDAEIDWHPKVTRAISQKIRGLQHRARAVLSLGNTVFVDPMVRVSQVPGMKTVINEYSVQSEILNTGMGVSNPEHLKLLRALCQEGEDSSSKEAGHTYGLKDNSVSLEVRIKAEEEVLAEVFRAAEARKLSAPPQLEPCEPLNPVSPMNHTPVPAPPACQLRLFPVFEQEALSEIQAADEQRYNHTPDLKSAKQMMRDGGELCPTTNLAACLNSCDSGGNESKSQQVTISTNEKHYEKKSFHPQIRWYQTPDAMIVTVKLMNAESQRCDFYPDRVIYSGRVNSQSYRAELELQGNIAVDRCCWEMKSNEPVLKLVKQQQGHWEKLLRNKNIFVSYDMEHFEENEDKAPNGLWFVGNTGEDNCYVNSESGSESD